MYLSDKLTTKSLLRINLWIKRFLFRYFFSSQFTEFIVPQIHVSAVVQGKVSDVCRKYCSTDLLFTVVKEDYTYKLIPYDHDITFSLSNKNDKFIHIKQVIIYYHIFVLIHSSEYRFDYFRTYMIMTFSYICFN